MSVKTAANMAYYHFLLRMGKKKEWRAKKLSGGDFNDKLSIGENFAREQQQVLFMRCDSNFA
ncbi:hypothetical protein KIN20_003801 [Parelaphostrongylus tenuis]|uniref:Uncharacterized protein n=1 Tax=Parelaphostrongylus tenuis TaxID=148309 RepID=A0AAD5QHL8_PARTN|nr:hypothetical protein KIN20_003801 [Parelaphostrongylus tenuis]